MGIASGRSYASILRDFPQMGAESAFILEGGGIGIYQGKSIFKVIIDKKDVDDFVTATLKLKQVVVIICSEDAAYYQSIINQETCHFLQYYYPNLKFVKDLRNITKPIIKMTVYDTLGSDKHSYPNLKHFNNRLQVVRSAPNWLDVSALGINKASALNQLVKTLEITKQEVIKALKRVFKL